MERIAVFPGSFDPLTKGHESLVKRATSLFDKINVAIGINANKTSMFSLEQRLQWLTETFINYSSVEVSTYEGLTHEYCKSINARYILRGLRSAADFEYEQPIAQANHAIGEELETIFMVGLPKFSAISSSIVRDIIRNGGDASQFLPDAVHF